MAKNLTEIFVNWSSNSSSHGYPNMFRTHSNFVRVMWATFLVVSMAMCSFFIANSFIEFFQFQTNSQISVVYESSLPFPAISVCTSNNLASPNSLPRILDHFSKRTKQNLRSFEDFMKFYDPSNQTMVERFKSDLALLRTVNDREMNKSDLRSLGFNQSEFIIKCRLGWSECESDKIVPYLDSTYGNCYRFNTGLGANGSKTGLWRQRDSGEMNGLSLRMFIGYDFYRLLGLFNRFDHFGAIVTIENQTSQPVSRKNMVHLRNGECSFIKLKKTVVTKLPFPYSDCKDAALYDLIFSDEYTFYNLTYEKETCLKFCKQRNIIQKCNCSSFMFPRLTGTRASKVCSSPSENACSRNETDTFDTETCAVYCPNECESINYEFETSSSVYPSMNYDFEEQKLNPIIRSNFEKMNFSAENLTYEQIQSSMACLYIYFQDISYVKIEETASRLAIDLLSGVGGTLGLCTGISLLSFCEVFELIAEMIIWKMERKMAVDPNVKSIVFVKPASN